MSGERVLVVDDDASVLRTMQRLLQPQYEVRCTASPLQAPQDAVEFRPDIAICDIRMPELSGFELLDRLRAVAPELDIILMTGSVRDQDTHLVRALRERAFYFILKPFERDVLLALIERCAEMRRLRHAERAHLARMKHELLAAQAFQQAMLAPAQAMCCGFSIVVDVLWQPCSEVGGDFYDYVETPSGDMALILADVRGHGVPAALLTATVKTLFRTAAMEDRSASELAEAIVHALHYFKADQFLTGVCARLNPRSGTLQYVNAGHPPPLLAQSGAATRLLPSNAPLLCTIFPAGSWPQQSIQVPAGGRVLLYTDGFSDGTPATHDSLVALAPIVLAQDASGADILRRLADAPARGPRACAPPDDLSLLLVQRGAEASAS